MITSKCQICGGSAPHIGDVDMARSCLPTQISSSEERTPYAQCIVCGFCFAPEFLTWTPIDFASKIYNEEYIKFDPAYALERPRANAKTLQQIFGHIAGSHSHLDYGGGSGITSEILRTQGWISQTFDPYSERDDNKELPKTKFNLITAFEVFEHAADIHLLLRNITSLIDNDGLLLFSTLLSDGNIKADEPLTWWYAGPRNGHISLFSYKSLKLLASSFGLQFESYSAGIHSFFVKKPRWANHLIPRQESKIYKTTNNQIVRSLFGDIICDANGSIEDFSLISYGEFRNAHKDFFLNVINDGDNILEIGATNASFSLPIAKHISSGHFVSLASSQSALQKIAGTLAINNCNNGVVLSLKTTETPTKLLSELEEPRVFQGILSHYSIKNSLAILRGRREYLESKPVLLLRVFPDEDTNSSIEEIKSEGYKYWLISSKEYNRLNHFKNECNIFGDLSAIYALFIPEDSLLDLPAS